MYTKDTYIYIVRNEQLAQVKSFFDQHKANNFAKARHEEAGEQWFIQSILIEDSYSFFNQYDKVKAKLNKMAAELKELSNSPMAPLVTAWTEELLNS